MTSTTASKPRKQTVNHQHLAILALMNGADAMDAHLVGHSDPVGVLNKVRETFLAGEQDTTALDEKIALWTERKQPGVKGRKPATLGDTRAYRVQQISDDGDPFIRLPVSLLGVSKGAKVEVYFSEGQILVSLPVSKVEEDNEEAADGDDN